MSEAENQEKPKRDIKKLMAMVYVAVNIGAMGLGSFLVYVSTIGHKPPAANSEELNREIASFRKTLLEKPMTYTMETFNTNLQGLPRRMIRVEMNLEMLDAEGFEEVINLGARGRDSIVRILNNKAYDDIETVQGKLHLKNEIIAQLNSQMERGVVKNIFFSNFVVQ